jgi:hypothetical protein
MDSMNCVTSKGSFGTAARRLTKQLHHFICPFKISFRILQPAKKKSEWKMAKIVFIGRSDGG